jgi:hypothetical protein
MHEAHPPHDAVVAEAGMTEAPPHASDVPGGRVAAFEGARANTSSAMPGASRMRRRGLLGMPVRLVTCPSTRAVEARDVGLEPFEAWRSLGTSWTWSTDARGRKACTRSAQPGVAYTVRAVLKPAYALRAEVEPVDDVDG